MVVISALAALASAALAAGPAAVSADGSLTAPLPVGWSDASHGGAQAPFVMLVTRKTPPGFLAVAAFGHYSPATAQMGKIAKEMEEEAAKIAGPKAKITWHGVQATRVAERLATLWNIGTIAGKDESLNIGAFRMEDNAYGFEAYGMTVDDTQQFLGSLTAQKTGGSEAVAIGNVQSNWFESPGRFKIRVPGDWQTFASTGAVLALKSKDDRLWFYAIKSESIDMTRSLVQSDAQAWQKAWASLGTVAPGSYFMLEPMGSILGGAVYSFTLTNDVGIQVAFADAGIYTNYGSFLIRAQDMTPEYLRSILPTITSLSVAPGFATAAKAQAAADAGTPAFLAKAGPSVGSKAKGAAYAVLGGAKTLMLFGVAAALLLMVTIIGKIIEKGEPPPPPDQK